MNTTWTIITVIMTIGTTLMVAFMVGYIRFLIRKIVRLKKERDIYMMRIDTPPGRDIAGSDMLPPGHPDRPSMRPIF